MSASQRVSVVLPWLLLVALSATAAITGTVVGSDGAAIAGAKVAAFAVETSDAQRARWSSATPARVALASATADTKGNFSIDVAPPVVDLRIEAPGHGAIAIRAAANDDAGVLPLADAALAQATVTAGGKPLAGATVIVVHDGAETIAVTGADGRYALPDPKRQPSHLLIRHHDYATFESDLGPTRPAKGDVRLTPGRALHGRVVAADGMTPVAEAAIAIDNLPVATTAADGSFAVEHVAGGARRIAARSGDAIALRQLGAATDAELVLRLAPAASVSGSVRDLVSGMPIAGVDVAVATSRFTGTDPGATAITDAKGNYRIGGLAGGEYEVTAIHPRFAFPRLPTNLQAGRAAQVALYGAPLASIAGTVLDDDARGVAGARVRLRAIGGDGDIAPALQRVPRPAITAADGRFLLRSEIDGNVQLDATKSGWPAAHSNTLRLANGVAKRGVTIVLPRGVALRGRVVDRDRKPVAGAGVLAAQPGAAAAARRMLLNSLERGEGDDVVRSGADGTFTLRLREGTYDLLVTAAGFAPRTLRAQASAGAEPVEVTLEPGVEVSGRVTRGGTPVEAVNVLTISGDAGMPVQTAADGTFRLQDVAPGEMLLSFRKPEEWIQTTRAVTAPASGVNVDLPAGGRIAGHVVDKATHRPVTAFDAGVAPSRGGAVMMVAPLMRGFTSDDGAFVLDGVPAGVQTLAVSAPGYVMARLPHVEVESGRTVDDLMVALERGARLHGRVTSTDGAPLGGVAVRGMPVGAAANEPFTTTGPDGDYALENLEQGETSLTFSRRGAVTLTKRVVIDGELQQLDVQLASGASIGGRVMLENGTPVAGARIEARSPSAGGVAVATESDGDGAFTIDGAAAGRYELRASRAGLADALLRDVDVATDAATAATLRLVMKRGGSVAGRISGLTPAELHTATVHASSADGGDASASPDESGSYRIDAAPTGEVRVSATAGEFTTRSRNAVTKVVRIEPGTVANADFDFASDIVVRGRVTRRGAPVAAAMVAFTPRTAAQRYARATADADGRYEIDGIDEGRYNVSVTESGRAAWSTAYDVSGSATFDIDMRGATVAGVVTDATSGAAVEGAVVELRGTRPDAPYLRSTSSDANGSFAFDQVPAGSYEARAEKSHYAAASVPLTVGDAGLPDVSVKLAAAPGLVVRLLDGRDARPLAGWYHAAGDDWRTYDGTIDAVADPSPINLGSGSYQLTVGAYGYAPRSVRVTAPGAESVALTPGGAIIVTSRAATAGMLRIVDASGTAYRLQAGAAAGVVRLEAAPAQTRIANVAPGTYTLQRLDGANQVVATAEVTVVEGAVAAASL